MTPSDFARTVASHLASKTKTEEHDVTEGAAHLRLEDLYLAAACAAGDAGAIWAFEAAFFDEVDRAFPRASHSEAFLDDVRQNLREKLFVAAGPRPPEVTNYAGRGSLRKWFRIVLLHHTLNLKEKEGRNRVASKREAQCEPALLVAADPELLYLRERYSSEFRAAAAEAVLGLSADDRSVLRHHYVERLTIDQIGAIYGIHRVTAARRVNKARDTLVCRVRETLTARLRVEADELDSILRLLPTQFSLSLPRVLRV